MIRKHSDNERVGRYIICCRFGEPTNSENASFCKANQLITGVMTGGGQFVIISVGYKPRERIVQVRVSVHAMMMITDIVIRRINCIGVQQRDSSRIILSHFPSDCCVTVDEGGGRLER